mgnify:CR=1 FL=1
MGKYLSQNKIDAFNTDGFLSLINVFSIKTAQRLKTSYKIQEKLLEAITAAAKNKVNGI